jgi:hypothetical protein
MDAAEMHKAIVCISKVNKRIRLQLSAIVKKLLCRQK